MDLTNPSCCKCKKKNPKSIQRNVNISQDCPTNHFMTGFRIIGQTASYPSISTTSGNLQSVHLLGPRRHCHISSYYFVQTLIRDLLHFNCCQCAESIMSFQGLWFNTFCTGTSATPPSIQQLLDRHHPCNDKLKCKTCICVSWVGCQRIVKNIPFTFLLTM